MLRAMDTSSTNVYVRNDADLIGVRAGCTLTAFSSTGFSGKREAFKTEANDV